MSTTIGVLVTNYNSWPLALECIDANIRLCGADLNQIVLVDDCSPQSTPENIDARIDLIRNEVNLGFARSLNLGMAQLQTDIIVLFDADARPLTNYVDSIRTEFDHNSCLALLGFHTVDKHNRHTASWHKEPGLSTLLLGQALYARFQPWLERHENRICITTCAMAIRKNALVDLIGFDEQLDWLDVDLDFSMNIHRSGWTLKVSPDLVAFHEGGGTPMLTANRVLKYYQNRWQLLRKYGKLKHPKMIKAIVLARLWTEYLLLAVAGRFRYKTETVRLDKLRGRQKIIQFCAHEYR